MLGPGSVEVPASWISREFAGLRLAAHPDLPVHVADGNERDLLMLGTMLDPARPDRSDPDILQGLPDTTHDLGGRWVLVESRAGVTRVLNDATGLRAVFHVPGKPGWIASSPNLLAETLGLRVDPAIRDGFLDRDRSTLTGWWWPGTSTPYHEIERLVPNHVLDLGTGRIERFWPDRPRKRRDLPEVADEVVATLTGTMRAAANRFDLALALTGGRDSRLLLAFCREIRDRVLLYTARHSEMGPDDPDLVIPPRVANAVGIEYQRVEITDREDSALDAAYGRVRTIPRTVFPEMVRSLRHGLDEDRVCVQAVVNEIARTKYAYLPYRVEAEDLANMTYMGEEPLVIEQFSRWLEGARAAADRHGYRVEDLFYLEQRMGSWHAMNRTEFDLAHECLEPFNSRDLLAAILSLPRRDRTSWPNPLYDELFRRSWPEVLEVPLSPCAPHAPERGPVARFAYRAARTLGLRAAVLALHRRPGPPPTSSSSSSS